MGVKNVLAFKKNDVLEVAKILGYKISEKNELWDEGKTATCHSCNIKLTDKNLGALVKGSKFAFCDNPACYTRYLAERKENGN